MEDQKKRHHFVPVTYLAKFTDDGDRLYAYKKDDPNDPLHIKPDNIAYRKYYYSQPLPGGGRDNNKIEEFFSDQVEGPWKSIIELTKNRLPLAEHKLGDFYKFIYALRMRVPAMRDAVELYWANRIKQETQLYSRFGFLPPPPEGYEDLIDKITVSIDPHKSILEMENVMRGMKDVMGVIGLEVVHNSTEIKFITSDNPIVFFDPLQDEKSMRPYFLRQEKEIEFIFPLTPRTCLLGNRQMRDSFITTGITYRDEDNLSKIRRINRLISKFAYEWVFADSKNNTPVVKKYARESPVFDDSKMDLDYLILSGPVFKFGTKLEKVKWQNKSYSSSEP